MAAPALTRLVLAADPARWAAAGFSVEGGVATVGTTALELAGTGAGRGIVHWALAGLPAGNRGVAPTLDGLPTLPVPDAESDADPPGRHPNGAVRVDHVVAFTPSRDRTAGRLEAAGLDLRAMRDGPTSAGSRRQAFFRVGEALLEVIEHPPGSGAAQRPDAPARFWGLALAVADLDAAVELLGELLGEPHDAIQPGRRIASFRREARLGLGVALISD